MRKPIYLFGAKDVNRRSEFIGKTPETKCLGAKRAFKGIKRDAGEGVKESDVSMHK